MKNDPIKTVLDEMRDVQTDFVKVIRQAQNNEPQNVPYPKFCLHPDKCAGRSSCPRSYSCVD